MEGSSATQTSSTSNTPDAHVHECGTRDRLLQAACTLFHQHGYQRVSVSELCESARVKKGSFYHFFRSKRDLAIAMITHQWELIRNGRFEPAFRDDIPPLARIERFFCSMGEDLGAARTDEGCLCGCPFGNLALEMAAQDPCLREQLLQVYRDWGQYFEAALREAVRVGDLPPRDVSSIAESLVAFGSGIALLAKTSNSTDLAHRLAQRALDLVGVAGAPRGATAAA